MHTTESGSGTMIPCTDSGPGAVIPPQNEPSTINRSRAMMPGTVGWPRAVNPERNAEGMGQGVDSQIVANDSNGQKHPRSILKHKFKVWENQLINEIDYNR